MSKLTDVKAILQGALEQRGVRKSLWGIKGRELFVLCGSERLMFPTATHPAEVDALVARLHRTIDAVHEFALRRRQVDIEEFVGAKP